MEPGGEMGEHGFLGEFELVVMLAVLQVGEGAYAVNIRRVIEEKTGRSVSRGAVYVTLNRLEQKGLLASSLGEPTAARGGKAKRIFRVRAAGIQAIRSSQSMLQEMARGLDPLLEEA